MPQPKERPFPFSVGDVVDARRRQYEAERAAALSQLGQQLQLDPTVTQQLVTGQAQLPQQLSPQLPMPPSTRDVYDPSTGGFVPGATAQQAQAYGSMFPTYSEELNPQQRAAAGQSAYEAARRLWPDNPNAWTAAKYRAVVPPAQQARTEITQAANPYFAYGSNAPPPGTFGEYGPVDLALAGAAAPVVDITAGVPARVVKALEGGPRSKLQLSPTGKAAVSRVEEWMQPVGEALYPQRYRAPGEPVTSLLSNIGQEAQAGLAVTPPRSSGEAWGRGLSEIGGEVASFLVPSLPAKGASVLGRVVGTGARVAGLPARAMLGKGLTSSLAVGFPERVLTLMANFGGFAGTDELSRYLEGDNDFQSVLDRTLKAGPDFVKNSIEAVRGISQQMDTMKSQGGGTPEQQYELFQRMKPLAAVALLLRHTVQGALTRARRPGGKPAPGAEADYLKALQKPGLEGAPPRGAETETAEISSAEPTPGTTGPAEGRRGPILEPVAGVVPAAPAAPAVSAAPAEAPAQQYMPGQGPIISPERGVQRAPSESAPANARDAAAAQLNAEMQRSSQLTVEGIRAKLRETVSDAVKSASSEAIPAAPSAPAAPAFSPQSSGGGVTGTRPVLSPFIAGMRERAQAQRAVERPPAPASEGPPPDRGFDATAGESSDSITARLTSNEQTRAVQAAQAQQQLAQMRQQAALSAEYAKRAPQLQAQSQAMGAEVRAARESGLPPVGVLAEVSQGLRRLKTERAATGGPVPEIPYGRLPDLKKAAGTGMAPPVERGFDSPAEALKFLEEQRLPRTEYQVVRVTDAPQRMAGGRPLGSGVAYHLVQKQNLAKAGLLRKGGLSIIRDRASAEVPLQAAEPAGEETAPAPSRLRTIRDTSLRLKGGEAPPARPTEAAEAAGQPAPSRLEAVRSAVGIPPSRENAPPAELAAEAPPQPEPSVLPSKETQSAVQEQGSRSVLQRQSPQVGIAGRERGRVEQGVQGQETAPPRQSEEVQAQVAPTAPTPQSGEAERPAVEPQAPGESTETHLRRTGQWAPAAVAPETEIRPQERPGSKVAEGEKGSEDVTRGVRRETEAFLKERGREVPEGRRKELAENAAKLVHEGRDADAARLLEEAEGKRPMAEGDTPLKAREPRGAEVYMTPTERAEKDRALKSLAAKLGGGTTHGFPSVSAMLLDRDMWRDLNSLARAYGKAGIRYAGKEAYTAKEDFKRYLKGALSDIEVKIRGTAVSLWDALAGWQRGVVLSELWTNAMGSTPSRREAYPQEPSIRENVALSAALKKAEAAARAGHSSAEAYNRLIKLIRGVRPYGSRGRVQTLHPEFRDRLPREVVQVLADKNSSEARKVLAVMDALPHANGTVSSVEERTVLRDIVASGKGLEGLPAVQLRTYGNRVREFMDAASKFRKTQAAVEQARNMDLSNKIAEEIRKGPKKSLKPGLSSNPTDKGPIGYYFGDATRDMNATVVTITGKEAHQSWLGRLCRGDFVSADDALLRLVGPIRAGMIALMERHGHTGAVRVKWENADETFTVGQKSFRCSRNGLVSIAFTARSADGREILADSGFTLRSGRFNPERNVKLTEAESKALDGLLTPFERDLVEYMSKAYDALWPHMNAAYKRIHGRDMGYRDLYAHLTRNFDQPMPFEKGVAPENAVASFFADASLADISATRSREGSRRPLAIRGAMEDFDAYVESGARFATMFEPARRAMAVLRGPAGTALVEKMGESGLTQFKEMIRAYAGTFRPKEPVLSSRIRRFADKVASNMVPALLAARPGPIFGNMAGALMVHLGMPEAAKAYVPEAMAKTLANPFVPSETRARMMTHEYHYNRFNETPGQGRIDPASHGVLAGTKHPIFAKFVALRDKLIGGLRWSDNKVSEYAFNLAEAYLRGEGYLEGLTPEQQLRLINDVSARAIRDTQNPTRSVDMAYLTLATRQMPAGPMLYMLTSSPLKIRNVLASAWARGFSHGAEATTLAALGWLLVSGYSATQSALIYGVNRKDDAWKPMMQRGAIRFLTEIGDTIAPGLSSYIARPTIEAIVTGEAQDSPDSIARVFVAVNRGFATLREGAASDADRIKARKRIARSVYDFTNSMLPYAGVPDFPGWLGRGVVQQLRGFSHESGKRSLFGRKQP